MGDRHSQSSLTRGRGRGLVLTFDLGRGEGDGGTHRQQLHGPVELLHDRIVSLRGPGCGGRGQRGATGAHRGSREPGDPSLGTLIWKATLTSPDPQSLAPLPRSGLQGSAHSPPGSLFPLDPVPPPPPRPVLGEESTRTQGDKGLAPGWPLSGPGDIFPAPHPRSTGEPWKAHGHRLCDGETVASVIFRTLGFKDVFVADSSLVTSLKLSVSKGCWTHSDLSYSSPGPQPGPCHQPATA